MIYFMSTWCLIALMWIPQDPFDQESTQASGNGLMLSGNRPLPEQMLTKIYVAMWRRQATKS